MRRLPCYHGVMTSSVSDTKAPSFEVGARALLEELNQASALLATSKVIPAQVVALVERFDRALYARNPEAGLGSVDPYLAEGLLGGAVVCLKALRHDDVARSRRELRLGLEQVRQALRDVLDEHPVGADQSAKAVARWLADTVSVPQAEIARILDVSPRTFQRWLSETDTAAPTGDDEMRLRIVARLVSHLRHSFTGPGRAAVAGTAPPAARRSTADQPVA